MSQARAYKDLDLDFTPHPVKKDINKKTGPNAIVQSLKNLIQTNHYEKPFHPEIGSNVRKMLFEPLDSITANILGREISDVINNFEPRVKLENVYVVENFDGNGFDVTIQFFLENVPEPINLVFFLERLR
jgi:phage baseplate assembly protein W